MAALENTSGITHSNNRPVIQGKNNIASWLSIPNTQVCIDKKKAFSSILHKQWVLDRGGEKQLLISGQRPAVVLSAVASKLINVSFVNLLKLQMTI